MSPAITLMMSFGKKGQGEALIKLLVVAIIAIIALAVVKSYFRESSKSTRQTVEEIFAPAITIIPLIESLSNPIISPTS